MPSYTRPLYVHIADRLEAYQNSRKRNSLAWRERHVRSLMRLQELLPSGAGIDNGTRIDLDKSTSERLVFTTAFHHMNGAGCYNGWSGHQVIVTPSLTRKFNLRLTGQDKNRIKEHLGETFYHALLQPVTAGVDETGESTFQLEVSQ